jgi:hypothetical protein
MSKLESLVEKALAASMEHAKSSTLPFQLTKVEFIKVVTGRCYLCDAGLREVSINTCGFLDYKKGYQTDNVFTTCWTCKKLLMAKVQRDVLIEICKAIAKKHDKKQ